MQLQEIVTNETSDDGRRQNKFFTTRPLVVKHHQHPPNFRQAHENHAAFARCIILIQVV